VKRPTPPRRKKPLERSVLLQGGVPLARRTRLAPVSAKRRQENRERRAMAEQRWPDGRPMCVVPWCGRLADDLHEPLTRARLGSITDPDNTVPTCRGHNGELTEEPDWGYSLSLLVHSWDARTPAQVAADRRMALEAWPAREAS
jgi:hypothetical protein